ncbi:MAG: hypothetical protein JKX79_09515 [Labilibaculum sp.]|nr:hypothetical protein [Labilibaculum sp.]
MALRAEGLLTEQLLLKEPAPIQEVVIRTETIIKRTKATTPIHVEAHHQATINQKRIRDLLITDLQIPVVQTIRNQQQDRLIPK